MKPFKFNWTLTPVAVFIFFSILYLFTLYPDVGGRVNYGDSAKWQYLWKVNGTPHSTGYPLYLFLTEIFAFALQFLSYPYRILAISYFCGLLTIVTLYNISRRLIANSWIKIIPSLLLGLNLIFWSQATEVEVYTLNSLFVCLLVYYGIMYIETSEPKYLFITLAIYALSFGNHLSVITFIPALLYAFLITNNSLALITTKNIILAALIFALGASQYLYLLYLSHTETVYLEFIGKDASILRWLDYITGGQFRGELGNASLVHSLPEFISQTIKSSGLPLAVCVGFIVIQYKLLTSIAFERKVIFISLLGLTHLVFTLSYDIGDIRVYYIPIYICLFLLVGISLEVLIRSKGWIQKTLIFALFLAFTIQIFEGYRKMTADKNSEFQNIRSAFNDLPSNAKLMVPETTNRNDFFYYAGRHALNYLRYVEFADKNIVFIRPDAIEETQIEPVYTLNSFDFSEYFDDRIIFPVSENLSRVEYIKPPYKFRYDDRRLEFINWHEIESGHRWSNGKSSSLNFKISQSDTLVGELGIVFGTLGKQSLRVYFNESLILENVYEGWHTSINTTFDPNLIEGNELVSLRFEILGARSPGTDDLRVLGIALRNISIK